MAETIKTEHGGNCKKLRKRDILGWNQMELVGKGHWAYVYRCEDAGNRQIAIKICNQSTDW